MPPVIRAIVEAIGVHLGAPDQGQWVLELEFDGGRLRRWWRRDGPLPAGALERGLEPVIPAE